MADTYIRLSGTDGVTNALAQVRDAAGRFVPGMVTIGSDLIYAYGVETGFKRSGALARRAGPAYYLRGGLEAIQGDAQAKLAAALPQGANALDAAVLALGNEARDVAQTIVPVRSGALKNSITVRPRNAA